MKKILLTALFIFLVAGNAMAASFTEVIDDPGYFTNVDPEKKTIFQLVGEDAGYANVNTFGYYYAGDSETLYEVFSGSDYPTVTEKVQFAETDVFGFYLTSPDGTFYSDDSLNGDDFDHFEVWESGNGYRVRLYIEDLKKGGDQDFNDMEVLVKNAAPTPIPGAVWLFASGLIGLAGIRRKFKN
jgi:hypothetical protein